MAELGTHIILRLVNSQVIAPDDAARRRLARATLQTGRPHELLTFRAADTHLHVHTGSGREAAALLAKGLQISLRRVLDLTVGFERPRMIPIETQRHQRHVFFYVLGQEAHHDLCSDPRHEASNLPDLVGMRVTGAYTATNVRARLPRVKAADLWSRLPLPDGAAGPVVLDRLVDAAAAAQCLPDLTGRGAETVEARRAAVQIGCRYASVSEAARIVGVGVRWARRLVRQPAPRGLLRAVELQLRLRQGAAEPTFVEAAGDWGSPRTGG